jgi:type IV secretory pathway VirB6-like protein
MFKKRLLNKFVVFFMCCVVVFCNVLIPTQSIAYDGIRDDPDRCNIPEDSTQTRSENPCYTVNFNNDTNRCEVGSLKFSAMLPLNRDIEWEFFPLPGNHYCATFAIAHIVALYAAAKIGTFACSTTGLSAAIEAGNVIPGIGPQSLITQGLMGVNCSTAIAQCVSTAGATCPAVAPCCGALALYTGILTASVLELSIIFAIADSFFKETQICGWRWRGWEKETISSTEENQRGQKWQKSKGPYRKCIENIFTPNLHKTTSETGKVAALTSCGDPTQRSTKSLKNKSWREYVYGGMEYEDNGSNACPNPASWTTDEKNKLLGYDTNNQRYYFSGSGEGSAPNFACYRFLQKTANDPDGSIARYSYDCCVNRSQETLCVEQRPVICLDLIGENSCNNPKYKFCQADSKCDIEGVVFETFYGKKNTSYLCAQSYSVCPYNQTVAGGTEIAKYDESPLYSDVKLNFCQHLSHCWKLPLQPTVRSSEFSGNYIASACYDMKGDSQNIFDYNAGQLQISTRHFTAPFVQCFKETMENVFLNRAGHDVCTDSAYNSLPQCGGASNILYAQGSYLPVDQSFFKKIQDKYRMVLKMVLTISVMMLGISTLLAVPKLHLEKKVIMTFIIKLSLVMYFALGDGWQLSFANAVLNISSIMSDITFQPNLYDGNYKKLDGCQFPRYNSESASKDDYKKQSYPAGKEYLRIWDTLDCKIIKALGFGGEVSVPNILLIIIAGFFSSALGVIIFVATFVFGFILISIAIRAMHIFLISTSAIVILLFISPITITMVMFERTKKVFESWWKYLLGYSLQPMILFIYISIFLSAMDSILIGSAEYEGQTVQISSDKRYVGMTPVDAQSAIDNYGFIIEKNVNCSVGNASWDSIICIFNLTKFGKLSGFDTIGIGIPTITNITKEKLETITKAALIMFIFLNFIDTMTLFASKLVGGSEINSNWNIKTATMLKGAHNLLRGIQKRGMRAIVKHGASMARTGSQILKGGAELANRSKNIANSRDQAKNDSKDPVAPKGGDPVPGGNVGNKAGAGDDHPGRNDKAGGDGAKPSSPSGDHQATDSKVASGGDDHATRDGSSSGGDDHATRNGSSSGGDNAGGSATPSSAGADTAKSSGDHQAAVRVGDASADGGSATPSSAGGSADIANSSGDHQAEQRVGGDVPRASGSSATPSPFGRAPTVVGNGGASTKNNQPVRNDDFADRSDSQQQGVQGGIASKSDAPASLAKNNSDGNNSAENKGQLVKSPNIEGPKDGSSSTQQSSQGQSALSQALETIPQDQLAEDSESNNEADQSSQDDAASFADDERDDADAPRAGDRKGVKKRKSRNPLNPKKTPRSKPYGRQSSGSTAGVDNQGGGLSSSSSQIEDPRASSGDLNIPSSNRSAGETAPLFAGDSGSGGQKDSSPFAEKTTLDPASEKRSDFESSVKTGISDLSPGLNIGEGGDILVGMGNGLNIKSSSGDPLQNIIAQSSTSGVLSSRSLEASSSSMTKTGAMSGDQAMALYNQMKNGDSQGEISGASQGKSSSITSSQFPPLRDQLGARSSSSTPVNQQPQGNISQQVKKIVEAQAKSRSSSGGSSPEKAQAKSRSSSGGSSPIDNLGKLGDLMAKGIEPLAEGISGAVDNLLGIGSAKSQRSQSSQEASPSPSQLSSREASPSSSESSSPRNKASQSAESSASPLEVRDQVRNAISNSALLQSLFQSPKVPSENESKNLISQAPQDPAPKDNMMQKPPIRDAWGEADASPPAPELNNQDDVAQALPASSKPVSTSWAKSTNKKPEQQIKNDPMEEMEVEEFEYLEEDDDEDNGGKK